MTKLEQLQEELAKKEQQLATAELRIKELRDAVTKERDWLIVNQYDARHLDIILAGSDDLTARDRKRDAALLWKIASNHYATYSVGTLLRMAESRESGEWEPELKY